MGQGLKVEEWGVGGATGYLLPILHERFIWESHNFRPDILVGIDPNTNVLDIYKDKRGNLFLRDLKDCRLETAGRTWWGKELHNLDTLPVKITMDIIDDMFYFCDEKLSQKTIDDILNGKISTALLIKRNGDLPGDIDEIVLQIVYGNSRRHPGSEYSPCQLLTVRFNEEISQNDGDPEEVKENNLVGIWAPPDKYSKALVLKHLFPNVSGPYKFPETEPTPYYLAVAYDAFKTREVMELSNEYPGQIMMYGFFTSDKPTEATLISKTVEEFDERTTPTTYFSEEKIVIQLANTNEECVNTFMELGPTYSSSDIEQGELDCKLFFPDGYNVPKEVIQEVKKKFKKKGRAKPAAINQEETTSTATSDIVKEQEELEPEELEEGNSEDEKNECEILPEEDVEDADNVEEEGESTDALKREADKATSPLNDSKIDE